MTEKTYLYKISGRLVRLRIQQGVASPPVKPETMKSKYSNVEIDGTACTACGMCVAICPGDALIMKKTDGKLSAGPIDGAHCDGCGFCRLICPVDAIAVMTGKMKISLV